MAQLKGHQTWMDTDAGRVLTLADILPERPGLRMLIVGKTPAPDSVKVGHYFQGRHGTFFWNLLKEWDIFAPASQYQDDDLLSHGFGITDIAKVPRPYGGKVSPTEYLVGSDRILKLIHEHRPKVVHFVYKTALDEILKHRFGRHRTNDYGVNPELDSLFRSIVFTFPMMGTRCKKAQQVEAMTDLARIIGG